MQNALPNTIDRVFDFRRPINLIVGIVLILVCVPFGIAGFLASARGEVTVNGVAGNGSFQVFPAILFSVIPLCFVVLGMMMILSFFNERIEWKGGWISWHDRFGRLKVRAAITDIYNVFREDSMFATDYVVDDGFGRRTRKRNVGRIVIETASGSISFYETVPWAGELEAMAKHVVGDKIPPRDLKPWQGG
ncbi:MAG: hypothetical protein IT203_10735 [Fimbriimonadaceae bacterium]|nr:hypothetical protein [Fimbriimonadaceae bacterium]